MDGADGEAADGEGPTALSPWCARSYRPGMSPDTHETATSDAPRRLVLGDDRSSGADIAWLWVNCQHWPGWDLVVLQADRPPFGATVAAEQAAPHDASEPSPRPVFTEPGFHDVRFREVVADPRLALTEDTDASLIVVGVAASGFGRSHVGSTTEWLLHDAQVPTVIARHGFPIRRAVVCVDGSAHAEHAAVALASMPWVAGVEVVLLAVDDGRTDTATAIETTAKVFDGSGALVTALVRSGKPHREILAAVEDAGVDLLVLGTHGLSTMRRLTLGSTASAVTRMANCSVLVAR